MAQKLDGEARVTIRHLHDRGHSNCKIAKLLGVSEGSIRYHLGRQAAGAVDGRSRQRQLADGWAAVIAAWIESVAPGPLNLAALHEYLVREHGYPGSVRSIQRYARSAFPKPARRARRRVETPPGAQAQADWKEVRGMRVAEEVLTLYAFHLKLSHSRRAAVVWSPRKDQLSWHEVHNGGLRRLEGVPASIRVDNERTAVSRGAGVWGEINPSYRRYAQAVRFHIDPCPPRSPEAKGKVEREIRTSMGMDPRRRHWEAIEELQAVTDAGIVRSAERRICPATGTTIGEAWEAEKRFLAPLPILPEAFDIAVMREVSVDCLVSFEGRRYSAPFPLVGRRVEVRGCARTVQILADGGVVTSHARGTAARLVIDPAHFEGADTKTVRAPLPLGRMGRRLQEIAAMPPERRPLDLYAALAEVAR